MAKKRVRPSITGLRATIANMNKDLDNMRSIIASQEKTIEYTRELARRRLDTIKGMDEQLASSYPVSMLENVPFQEIERAHKEGAAMLDALKAVYGAKRHDRGDPLHSFNEIAHIANAIKDKDDPNVYHPEGCCRVLMALKLARIKIDASPDSFVDLIGYTDIAHKQHVETRRVKAMMNMGQNGEQATPMNPWPFPTEGQPVDSRNDDQLGMSIKSPEEVEETARVKHLQKEMRTMMEEACLSPPYVVNIRRDTLK